MDTNKPVDARTPSTNSTFAIGAVSCSLDSLMVAESFVLRIKFSGKNPAHRKSAKRYIKFKFLNLWLNFGKKYHFG